MDILQVLIDFFTGYGYFAVFFVLLICGFGVPIPEDITLVAGGVISGLGYTNEHVMFAVGMAGGLAGRSDSRKFSPHWSSGLISPRASISDERGLAY